MTTEPASGLLLTKLVWETAVGSARAKAKTEIEMVVTIPLIDRGMPTPYQLREPTLADANRLQ